LTTIKSARRRLALALFCVALAYPANAKIRNYYIAAERVEWDYAPNPLPLVPRSESELVKLPVIQLKTFEKAVYHEYTDGTFQTLKPRAKEWEHLGMLGPLIRAEVGDTIQVVFKNNANTPYSMHPHGLSYDKESEGAYYFQDGRTLEQKKGATVRPGHTFTYTWTVPESAGPGPHDGSSMLWMYHSHFAESRDINSGLLGPIIVTRKGEATADGAPRDVDREFVVAFAIYDESESAYFMENLVRRAQTPTAKIRDPNFAKALQFFTMNGFIKGNLPLLTMKKGERVRWYLMSSANEDDVHSPHWHGQTVLSNMMRTDTLALAPMGMMVADMIPESTGIWLFHCHVNEHLQRGMVARFEVLP
jgi:FtsP/CotA-like multicopper oxidase with cupredoxin domain